MRGIPLSELLLRVGVAFSFLYPPIAALSDPYSWIGYFPAFFMDFVGPHSIALLHVFGIVEVILAVWILFGKRIFIPSVLAAILLLAIVSLNQPQFPILFRDISIALMAFALASLHRPTHVSQN